jgi:hypothetical protein
MYFLSGHPGPRTGRGFSNDLWAFGKYGGCPDHPGLMNPNNGYGFFDDFLDLPTGRHTATQATQGTFALDDARYGVVLADCNSATATQGINVQRSGTVGESFTPLANTVIWGEGRIKAADIATGPEFFWGLAVIDTSIIASSAISAQAIGFKSQTDDNVILATCKDGSGETTAASIHTFVDGTWVKLGFRVSDTSVVEFFVNGVKVATITANIPTTDMVPSVVCQSGGTTDPIIHMDWWSFAVQDSLLGTGA